MRWAVVLAALAIGIAAGWLAHGGGKTRDGDRTIITRDLAPPGAQVIDARVLRTQYRPNEIAVAWQRNPDRFPSEFGLTLWQRRSPGSSWRRLYERRIRQSKEHFIHDLRLRTADVTRDGREDLLVIEEIGGSAGAYTYRLLTTDGGKARQIAARETTQDNTAVFVEYGELVSYDGVGKDPKTIPGIHCCPLYWQRISKRWNGKTLVTARISRAKSRPLMTY